MVRANREVLAAIAGVFFLLPGLIGAVVLPTPALTSGMDQTAMADAIMQFYTRSGPALVALSLPMIAGYLTVLVVLIDRGRPTVGAAIVAAFRLLPGYVIAQVLVSMLLSALWVVALSLLALAMPQMLAVVVSLTLMAYPMARLVLIGPEMVAQRRGNPLRAIVGGLARTRGHGLRILLYLGPALTLFLVIYALVMIVVGIIAAAAAQGEAQRLIGEAVGAVLFAGGYVVYAAIVASTYDQLGPMPGMGEAVSPSSPS
jgi:hypothetical protein